MSERGVNTGFKPAFGSALEQLREYLRSQGIETQVISGVRTPEEHQMAWDNFLATRAGRPLPHPGFGPVTAATPPGQVSSHDDGWGADLVAVNPADQPKVWEASPKFGLRAIGPGDKAHVELAGWQKYASGAEDAPASKAIESKVRTPPMDDHSKFIVDYAKSVGFSPEQALAIANAEGLRAWSKSNPNAGSYVDRENGQPFSFGDFQLNVRNGLGVDALKAGVDPRDPNQWQAADRFAIDRMKSGGVGPWSGDPAAKAILAGKFTPGTNFNSTAEAPGPADPSIIARGGTSPPIGAVAAGTAAAPAAPLSFREAIGKGDWGAAAQAAMAPQKDAEGKDIEGSSPVDQLQKGLTKGTQTKEVPQSAPISIPQAPPLDSNMSGAAGQLMAANLAQMQKPMQWSRAPYGSQAGPQSAQQGSPFGTTLNSFDLLRQIYGPGGA